MKDHTEKRTEHKAALRLSVLREIEKKTETNPLIEFFDIAKKHEINAVDLHALVLLNRAREESGSHFYILFNYRELEKNGWLDSGLRYTEKANVLLNELLWLFKPAEKKKTQVPAEMVTAYVETFPKIKIPMTGKYARSNVVDLSKAFEWFLKTYDYSWDVILKATEVYVVEKQNQNWDYMRTSRYFISKEGSNKVRTSDLADYCEKVLNNDEPEELKQFHIKVV